MFYKPLVAEIDAKKAGTDEELDDYMTALTMALVNEKLGKKEKLFKELSNEFAKMDKLARVARPALQSLSDASNITPYVCS